MAFHRPRKRLSQNFLTDPVIIQAIIDGLNLNIEDPVLEIGPGKGALTQGLDTLGLMQLECVELDRDLAERLSQTCSSKVNIHCEDILTFDFNRVLAQGQRLQIVGNLPYHLSTPILIKCLDALPNISQMNFMLQKEVAQRICAQSGTSDYGRLSVRVQVACQAHLWLFVPPESFSPQPKVQSAMICLTPHDQYSVVNIPALDVVLRAAFSARRKQLRNSLKSLFVERELIDLGLDPSLRADAVSVAQFVRLAEAYHAD